MHIYSHFQHTDSQYQERFSTDDQDQDWQQMHSDLPEYFMYIDLNNINTMETQWWNLQPPTPTTRPAIEEAISEEVCVSSIHLYIH